MDIFYLILGVLLLALTIVDFLWTTIWVDGGAGPITNRLTMYLWKLLRKISGNQLRILSKAGPVILTATLLTWVLLIWVAWTLIFAGEPSSLIDSNDQQPVSWVERFYVTGYLIFTLGNGDYSPKEGFWQIASIIATGNGMLFITLAVTYVLSIIGAVSEQRALASSILGIGKTGTDLVKKSWNGSNFGDINLPLNSYATQLSILATKNKAYPILHYYYSDRTNQSIAVAMAVMDDALMLYDYGIRDENQPNMLLVKNAQASMKFYIETLPLSTTEETASDPPLPNLQLLRKEKLPTVQNESYHEAVSDVQDWRKQVNTLVQANGRQWPGDE